MLGHDSAEQIRVGRAVAQQLHTCSCRKTLSFAAVADFSVLLAPQGDPRASSPLPEAGHES